MELRRVAMATMPFFCLAEALGSDRNASFAESMDAIPSAASVGIEGCAVEVACESDGAVHVMSDVPSIPTPIRSRNPSCVRMGPHLERDPFGLSNLLPAGVLALTLSSPDRSLAHAASRETWPAFDLETARSLYPFCSPQDITVLESLSFLVEHEFTRITLKFLPLHSLLLLRVYLIPYDLPGVQGRLMNRQEHILGHYRRLMRDILPKLISDGDYWRGTDVLPLNPSLFLPPSLVSVYVSILSSLLWSLISLQDSRTMAEIYSELPSPELDELTDQARAILQGAPIFGLRSTLHLYQRKSVVAMLVKELPSQPVPDPAYIQVRGVGLSGGMLYLQPATLEVLRHLPRTSTVRGGILCEELGKAHLLVLLSLCTYLARHRKNGDDSVTHIIDGGPAPRSSRIL